jgi:hypothetical protein
MRAGRRPIIVAADRMIHGVLARPATAAMPPAPPMQRKAILRSIITVRATLPMRAAIALLRLLMLGLTASDERRQAIDIALVFRTGMLWPRLKMLLMLLRLIVLLIVVLLLARIIRLRLTWREWLAADMRLVAIAVVVALLGPAHLAGLLLLLLLVIRLTLSELLLRRGDDPEIVFGVLIIIFGCNRIAGALCVTSELKVLFSDVRRGSANFYVRPIGLIHSRQWILMMPTFAVATAHALVLTVSHDLLFRNPRSSQRHLCRRFSPIHHTHRTARRRSKSPSRFRLSSPVPIHKLNRTSSANCPPSSNVVCRAPMTCAPNR